MDFGEGEDWMRESGLGEESGFRAIVPLVSEVGC